jgi:hypothetical protein
MGNEENSNTSTSTEDDISVVEEIAGNFRRQGYNVWGVRMVPLIEGCGNSPIFEATLSYDPE